MAWTLVGRKLFPWADSSTSKVVSLTDLTGGLASAPAAGDVVAFFYYHGVTSQVYTLGFSESGYTTKADANAASPGVSALAGVKVMGGTPDTTLTLTSSNGFNGMSRLVAIEVWRGGDGTQPDVSIVSANGATGNPNPPSITPTTTGALILCSGGGGSYTPISAYTSANLSSFTQEESTGGSTVDVRGAVGREEWSGGAFDAAAFGGGGGVGWAAFALALRPEPISTGVIAATETIADSAALVGEVIVSGALAMSESASDVAAIAGDVLLSGVIAASETGADSSAIAGNVPAKGVLSAAESGQDTFIASGVVSIGTRTGSLAALETGQDQARLIYLGPASVSNGTSSPAKNRRSVSPGTIRGTASVRKNRSSV